MLTKEKVWAVLEAPGSPGHVRVDKMINHTIQYTAIDVDTNVVVRMEGSNDGQNWFNLDTTGSDTTITDDITDGFALSNFVVKYIRPVWVSESGGTAATIQFKYRGNR